MNLSSAVTVLSSDDPVRVFQDFAQVDLLSGGRAETSMERFGTEVAPLVRTEVARRQSSAEPSAQPA